MPQANLGDLLETLVGMFFFSWPLASSFCQHIPHRLSKVCSPFARPNSVIVGPDLRRIGWPRRSILNQVGDWTMTLRNRKKTNQRKWSPGLRSLSIRWRKIFRAVCDLVHWIFGWACRMAGNIPRRTLLEAARILIIQIVSSPLPRLGFFMNARSVFGMSRPAMGPAIATITTPNTQLLEPTTSETLSR